LHRNNNFPKLAPLKTFLKIASAAVLLSTLVIISPVFSKTIKGFWLKGNQETVEKAFYHSRGGGIAFQWRRFLEQPLTGHGFGIDVAHGNEKRPGTFLGIPISASTEKGFLPTAFLEEVGLLGALFFAPFLFALLKGASYQSDIGLIAMFFACLFVNIGEAVFFSPGQIGGFFWVIIGLSTARKCDERPGK
jgi:hypothetical protein